MSSHSHYDSHTGLSTLFAGRFLQSYHTREEEIECQVTVKKTSAEGGRYGGGGRGGDDSSYEVRFHFCFLSPITSQTHTQ